MNSPLSQNQSLITILNLPWILAVLNLNYAQSRKLPSMNHKPSTQNLGSSNSYLIPKISDVQAQRNNIWENTYSILHVRWLDMKFFCITSSSIHPTKCIDDLYFIHRLAEREKIVLSERDPILLTTMLLPLEYETKCLLVMGLFWFDGGSM